MADRPLDGFVVGVTADRRWEEQVELLRRRGATVMHGPVMKTLALGSERGLRTATEALLHAPPDIVVANTGIGIRGWLSAAEGWGWGDDVAGIMRRARVLARGPKAAGAVVTAGCAVEWRTASGRMRDLVAHLLDQGVDGARVAMQLDGGCSDATATPLRDAGADVVTLPVYRWTAPDDVEPAERRAEAVVDGRVDAVTFTSAYAVTSFLSIAGHRDIAGAFDSDVLPVCIGPVCHDAAIAHGLIRAIQPERPLLGGMVNAMADALVAGQRVIATTAGDLQFKGAGVMVDGTHVDLAARERAVLRVLARRPGVVVAKRDLLHEVWGDADADDHALEVTVGRLRRRLRAAGGSIRTVVRRGYQLDVAPDQAGRSSITITG
jgi:uroporphyrinogen-III synthase